MSLGGAAGSQVGSEVDLGGLSQVIWVEREKYKVLALIVPGRWVAYFGLWILGLAFSPAGCILWQGVPSALSRQRAARSSFVWPLSFPLRQGPVPG